MRTELQRRTSRLNGGKSRGPRTAAGKRRSSQNACRHGLYSRHILTESLPAAPAPQSATTAEAAFHDAHLEYTHVATLEARILNEEIERQRILHPDHPDKLLSAIAFRHLCDETGVMVALYRLQSAATRRLERAIQRFQQDAEGTEFCGMNPPASSAPAEQTSFCGTNPTAPQVHAAQAAFRSTPSLHRASCASARRKTPLRRRIRRLPPRAVNLRSRAP
jgi:hypothetical protein